MWFSPWIQFRDMRQFLEHEGAEESEDAKHEGRKQAAPHGCQDNKGK